MSSSQFPYGPKSSQLPADQLVNDQVLWQSIRKGNHLAFSSLYKKYVNPLYNYGMHIHADHDEVVDTIQELFVNIWSRRESMAEVSKVKYYVFKSFKNLYIRRISREKQLIHSVNFSEYNELKVDSFEQELIVSQSYDQRIKSLQNAINELTKRQKEAVILRFYNELSFQEVGSLMGISVDSVHNLLSKAIGVLRKSKKLLFLIFSLCSFFLSVYYS
jgi:RNA polymerase sigma factor (sigma-70 family)